MNYLIMPFKVFGATATGDRLERILASPHYRDGAFQNPEPTEMMLQDISMIKLMGKMLNKPKDTVPPHPLPSVRTDLRSLSAGTSPKLIWFGHSSYYILSKESKILVDPVFSGRASPVPFFGRAFPGTNTYSAQDFDRVDVMVLTHDHYDHLDYGTIRKLSSRVGVFVTALGVGAHLAYWGVPPHKIIELDLGEMASPMPGVQFTSVPARHFSGRTTKRNQTLWCSFVLQLGDFSLFLGGDTGYGKHLKAIGEQFGPFHLAILESGQYSQYWPFIHMMPEQTVQAARDLGARALLPVHWGKFSLSIHSWNEPIVRLTAEAARVGMPVITPKIGEMFELGGPYPNQQWW